MNAIRVLLALTLILLSAVPQQVVAQSATPFPSPTLFPSATPFPTLTDVPALGTPSATPNPLTPTRTPSPTPTSQTQCNNFVLAPNSTLTYNRNPSVGAVYAGVSPFPAAGHVEAVSPSGQVYPLTSNMLNMTEAGLWTFRNNSSTQYTVGICEEGVVETTTTIPTPTPSPEDQCWVLAAPNSQSPAATTLVGGGTNPYLPIISAPQGMSQTLYLASGGGWTTSPPALISVPSLSGWYMYHDSASPGINTYQLRARTTSGTVARKYFNAQTWYSVNTELISFNWDITYFKYFRSTPTDRFLICPEPINLPTPTPTATITPTPGTPTSTPTGTPSDTPRPITPTGTPSDTPRPITPTGTPTPGTPTPGTPTTTPTPGFIISPDCDQYFDVPAVDVLSRLRLYGIAPAPAPAPADHWILPSGTGHLAVSVIPRMDVSRYAYRSHLGEPDLFVTETTDYFEISDTQAVKISPQHPRRYMVEVCESDDRLGTSTSIAGTSTAGTATILSGTSTAGTGTSIAGTSTAGTGTSIAGTSTAGTATGIAGTSTARPVVVGPGGGVEATAPAAGTPMSTLGPIPNLGVELPKLPTFTSLLSTTAPISRTSPISGTGATTITQLIGSMTNILSGTLGTVTQTLSTMKGPMSLMATQGVSFSLEAGEQTAVALSATMRPGIEYITIMNPNNDGWKIECSALWALQPIIAPFYPILFLTILFRFADFMRVALGVFLNVLDALRRLVDIIMQIVQAIASAVK